MFVTHRGSYALESLQLSLRFDSVGHPEYRKLPLLHKGC